MDVEILDRTELVYCGIKIEWVLTPEGRKAAKAADVVTALGKDPKDTSRLVNLNVFPDYRFQSSFGNSGRPSNYLYEQGVVQLATKIDSLEAEPFQRWVFETVVKIFTSGGYINPDATSTQLTGLMVECDRLKEKFLDVCEKNSELYAALSKSEDQSLRNFQIAQNTVNRDFNAQLRINMEIQRQEWSKIYNTPQAELLKTLDAQNLLIYKYADACDRIFWRMEHEYPRFKFQRPKKPEFQNYLPLDPSFNPR
jgi:prophage antirepressor-like protein